MWALKLSSGAATAEASDVSFNRPIAKLTRDGKVMRKAWAIRWDEGSQSAEAEGVGGLDLAPADRLDPGAEHLGQVGAAVEAEPCDCRGDGVETDADRGKAEIDDEKLGKDRNGAEHLDIGISERAQARGFGRSGTRQTTGRV